MIFKGTILDENSLPLPNVNISFPQIPFVGNITDFNGNFYIDNSQLTPLSTVLVSYVGYKPLTTTVSAINNAIVSLLPSEEELEEVVVIGSVKQSRNWLLIGFATFSLFKLKNLIK